MRGEAPHGLVVPLRGLGISHSESALCGQTPNSALDRCEEVEV